LILIDFTCERARFVRDKYGTFLAITYVIYVMLNKKEIIARYNTWKGAFTHATKGGVLTKTTREKPVMRASSVKEKTKRGFWNDMRTRVTSAQTRLQSSVMKNDEDPVDQVVTEESFTPFTRALLDPDECGLQSTRSTWQLSSSGY
jgi:hypothetical protein